MDTNDLRVLRDRHADLEDAIDRADSPPQDGGRALLCQTVQVASYPTSAGVMYGVVEAEASGSEQEGATPTFTPDDIKNVFYALDAQRRQPDVGTQVICRYVGGKWCF